MDKNKDYLSILKESLEKKLTILEEILKLNDMQKEAVSGAEIDGDGFDEIIGKKDACIKDIEELDKGFESIYNHVKDVLLNDTDSYTEEISVLKHLISDITEKSMEVQLSEKRNEKLVYKRFSEERQKIHQSKTANRVASDYYRNMSKSSVVEPQFLDKKK